MALTLASFPPRAGKELEEKLPGHANAFPVPSSRTEDADTVGACASRTMKAMTMDVVAGELVLLSP